MLCLKSGRVTAKTAKLTFHTGTESEKEQAIALALLTGAFNPLRKHSKNDSPINYEKLRELQDRLAWLLYDTKSEMDVKISEVSEL